MQLTLQIIAPIAVVLLAFLSLLIRWIGGFGLSSIGSDLSLIATSLQLRLLYTKIGASASDLQIGVDIIIFIIAIIGWTITLKLIQGYQKDPSKKSGNWRLFFSILLGCIFVFLQIFWSMSNAS